jgi:hypothetical protein
VRVFDRPKLLLIVATSMAIALAVLADAVTGEMAGVGLARVLQILLLSPVWVTFGGAAVAPAPTSWAFAIGGLLFWPGYVFLARRWLRQRRPMELLSIFLWTLQAYFHVFQRAEAMLGV